ncbi:Cna B-type domain-containing protein [Peptostreptococcus sp. D1]|uniref:Cna B-type domain-containing protein n=1 Tax=Peptostreptococcus sp. D1 TaxID=72304 RepID=UPI0008DFA201|nr:Cna B-type domain-containing protein [Peptostreptococcus sp. D1]SFE37845.1 LPXTG-motif cell wall anchor domain-containing protein [Peptostreptococcus sp. D1]
MKKRGNIQKLTSFFLVFVMLLGMFIPIETVFAENKEVQVNITDFSITNSEGVVPPDGYFSNSLFKLNYKWDASSHGNELHEGDYFEIDLPDQFKFPPESSYCNFDINAPSGELMARAVITPQEPGGGKIKVTFTSYVNDKFNITGDMHLTARWNTTSYPVEQEGEYEIAVGSFNPHITLKPYVPPQYGNEILYKVSGQTLTSDSLVRWRIRINAKQGDLNNVIIKDTLEVEDPGSPEGIEYVAGEFVLYEIVFEDGKPVEKNPVNVSNQVTLSSDKRSFTYSMGNLDGKAYMLHYRSTYRQGLKLKNTAELTSTETGKIVQSQFQDAESGGGGQGNLTSKIKIVKVAEDNEEIKLKNAKFKITRKASGATFEVITDSNGEAVTMQLIPGEYEIEEIAAPDHYLVDNTKYTVVVTSDNLEIKTITNEPEKIDIKVQKKWIGPVGSEVTVVLKADGVPVAEHKLSAPDWEYTFTNLRKYNAKTGEEIKYIAEEKDVLQGYTPSISGSIGDGFIITNTNNEKVDIPVEKKWVGPAGDSVVVQVKAEGSNDVVAEYELKANENWEHIFTGLDKYAPDGTLIKYKVVEKNVPNGYKVSYEKDPTGKWVITNTNVEKTEVSVKKKWIGAERDSVLVELRAEGSNDVIKEYELKKSEGWKHTFTGLDKYTADGTLIKYKVVEKNVPQGYAATYEQESDNLWIIKNTQDKTEVKVTKEWEGVTGNHPTIKLQLLKNGQNEGSPIELTNGTTTYTWTDLDKTDAQGNEYNYTVKEVGETANSIQLNGDWYKVSYGGNTQDGLTVTNKKLSPWTPMIPPTRDIKVTKEWKDISGSNLNEAPVDKIKVELYKDGIATGDIKELTKDNNWTVTFEKLKVYESIENPTIHKYTVKEVGEVGSAIQFNDKWFGVSYDGTMADGFTITNKEKTPWTPMIPPTRTIKVTKAWDLLAGNNIPDTKIEVELYKDGDATGKKLELTKDNNWTGEFKNLEVADGLGSTNYYKYTVKEVGEIGSAIQFDGKWFGVSYDGTMADGFTITNKEKTPWTPMEPPTRTIKVTKEWKNDNGNVLTAPVEKVEVELYKDGVATGKKLELTKDNNWTGEFKNLEVADGLGSTNYYQYTVKEIGETTGSIKLDGKWFKVSYSGSMKDGFTITNQKEKPWTPMEPPIREVKVTKLWKDHKGNTITAPTEKITVELYKDGNPTGKTLELNAGNNWSGVFKNLAVANGLGSTDYYKYTVKEVGEDGNAIKFDGKQYKVVYGGSMKDGLTITNEKETPPTPPNTEKPKVPNTSTNNSLPKTGDGANLSLYAWLMFASGSLLILLGIRKRKHAK